MKYAKLLKIQLVGTLTNLMLMVLAVMTLHLKVAFVLPQILKMILC